MFCVFVPGFSSLIKSTNSPPPNLAMSLFTFVSTQHILTIITSSCNGKPRLVTSNLNLNPEVYLTKPSLEPKFIFTISGLKMQGEQKGQNVNFPLAVSKFM